MEIICNQNELNNAIQLVSKAVASRPTHPILANIILFVPWSAVKSIFARIG